MTDSTDRKDTEALEKMLPGTEGLKRIRILADLTLALREINPGKAIEYGEHGLELLRCWK